MNNFSFEVFEKISDSDRINWHLYVDAVYRADPNKKDISAEVLSKLLGVKNQGGFRYFGKTQAPNFVVLFSTGEDIYWRDEIDNNLGLFIYYGDNKTPGNDLHKTNLHGNEILRYIFELASSDNVELRKKMPPILVFKKTTGWDVKFLGLAVPGIKSRPSKEWLIALWGQNYNGDRFQNYKAYFTILDTSTGCKYEESSGINLAWINDIRKGNAYGSEFAPIEWKKYIEMKKYSSLVAKVDKFVKTKEEQLPSEKEKIAMLKVLQDYFISKDRGYSFEQFASDLLASMDASIVNIETTRPFRDGGFDAIGQYRIFKEVENSVYVDFYMQAKCYKMSNSVKVADTARLISRIKNRQFGIMVTTSYVADQAYKEILEDKHPIVIVTGNDIIEFIFNEFEIHYADKLIDWLEKNY